MNKTFLRKTALELQALDNKEVVKVASVLSRIKSFFKKLVDPDFKAQVMKMEGDSKNTQSLIIALDKEMGKLQTAIRSGDVKNYNTHLNMVRALSVRLWDSLKEISSEGKDVGKIIEYYTRSQMKEPGFEEKFKNRLPSEYDIDLGKVYNRKLKSFGWYANLNPASITVRQGEGVTARKQLIDRICETLVRDKFAVSVDKAREVLLNHENELLSEFTQAIVEGTLIGAEPKRPSKKIQQAMNAQTVINVTTSPFVIPTTDIAVQATVKVIDLKTSMASRDKLSLLATTNVTIVRGRTKIAAVSPINLPDQFWIKFIQMCNRINAKPEDLARVIYAESGFNPHAVNYQNGKAVAKGLNQLILKTAEGLGMSPQEWMNYENVPAENQLEYVEKYFRSVGKNKGWDSATQLYVANFAPKHINHAANPNAVLYDAESNPLEYHQNKGLDRAGKGYITAGDMARSVQGKLPDNIINALNKAKMASDENGSTNQFDSSSMNEIDSLINTLYADDVGPLEKLVKHAVLTEILPTTDMIILVNSENGGIIEKKEFAKAASHILRKFIDASVSVHSDNKAIEIQCKVLGSALVTTNATQALCDCVADAMKIKTGTEINAIVVPGFLSKYAQLDIEDMDRNHRIFKLKSLE